MVEFIHARGDGLLSVFVPHATAGVAIIETRPGSDYDLLAAIEDMMPRNGDDGVMNMERVTGGT